MFGFEVKISEFLFRFTYLWTNWYFFCTTIGFFKMCVSDVQNGGAIKIILSIQFGYRDDLRFLDLLRSIDNVQHLIALTFVLALVDVTAIE